MGNEFDKEKSLEKIHNIELQLKSKFCEREEVIESIFASIVSGQHLLMVGPPGTAKSEMIHEITNSIYGAEYFSILLTEFTTPQEIFGPYSFQGLKEDKLTRKTEHFLPTAEIAFVDEIFKASSAILNTLLTIINERVFYDNGRPIKVPLLSLFAASNEYPNETDSVAALYDRFLFRFPVGYISDEKIFKELLKTTFSPSGIDEDVSITISEIMRLRKEADKILLSDSVYNTYSLLRKNLTDQNIKISDRRYIWALRTLKTYALLNGGESINESYFKYLLPMLWEKEADISTVKEILDEHVDITKNQVEKLTKQADSILSKFTPTMTNTAKMQMVKKMAEIVKDLEALNDNSASQVAGTLREQVKNLMTSVKGDPSNEGSGTSKINSVNFWGGV